MRLMLDVISGVLCAGGEDIAVEGVCARGLVEAFDVCVLGSAVFPGPHASSTPYAAFASRQPATRQVCPAVANAWSGSHAYRRGPRNSPTAAHRMRLVGAVATDSDAQGVPL